MRIQWRKVVLAGFSLITATVNAQTVDWAGKFGGNGEDVVRKLYVDEQGNSYTTGYFTDTANFAISGAPVERIANGYYDAFVQKTNAAGELLWVHSFGSSGWEYGTAVVADPSGNVFVSGVFDSPTDFDPGVGESVLIPNGELDIFLVKLDASGNFLWAKSMGGTTYEESTGLGVDAGGAVYLSGYFNATADFDPGTGITEFTSMGLSDCFLAKYSAAGDLLWAKQYGGTSLDGPQSIKVTENGTSYISGFFKETVDFDPGTGVFELTGYNGLTAYILQLTSDGDFVRALKIESTEAVYGYAIDVDANGNIYAAGTFRGTVDLNPGSGTFGYTTLYDNGFIVKLDPSGAFLWGKNIESSEAVVVYSVDVNAIGNVTVSGYMETTTDFNPDPAGTFTLTPAPENAMGAYISILDETGQFIHAAGFGGCSFVDYHAAYSDQSGNLYISGAFGSTVDLDPNPWLEQLVPAAAFRDNYLIKILPVHAGLYEGKVESMIHVYPNPVIDAVSVTVEGNTANEVVYSVFDCTGKAVKNGLLKKGESQLDMSDLTTGFYTIQVNQQHSVKVIKN